MDNITIPVELAKRLWEYANTAGMYHKAESEYEEFPEVFRTRKAKASEQAFADANELIDIIRAKKEA